MPDRNEIERDPSEVLFFRKHLADRKRIQTAEGWRRTVLTMREEKRKKAKAARATSSS